MIKTLLLGLLGLAWGGFWGLVRDQDGPYWKGKPADASGNKWKEVGVALFGLPAALVVYWSWPPEPWWGGLVAAIFILVMLGGPWSFGHPKGYAQLDSERSKFMLAGLSALPGIGPGVVLVALGWWWLAPWPAVAGAWTLGAYLLARKLRGPDPHPYPHSTEIGAVLGAAVFYSVTLMLLG